MLAPLGATVPRSEGQRPVERKLQRLFRRENAQLIKRAATLVQAVSLLLLASADGLDVNLDAVLKYDGLDGTELAISESQGAWPLR